MYIDKHSVVIFWYLYAVIWINIVEFFANPSRNSTFQRFAGVAEIDSNNGIQIWKNYYTKEIGSTVDIHRNNTVIYICYMLSFQKTIPSLAADEWQALRNPKRNIY